MKPVKPLPPAAPSTKTLSTAASTKAALAPAIGALRGVTLSPPVAEALDFACRAHGSQRYGDEPYQVHLEEVMRACVRMGFADDMSLMAAALHDVIEDTAVGHAGLAAFGSRTFGAERGAPLAQLVRELSHDRGVDTADYLAAMSDGAFAVKLADRLANVERMGLLENSPDRAAYLLAKYGPEMALFAAEAEARDLRAPFAILAAAMAKTTRAIEGAVSAYELAQGRQRVADKADKAAQNVVGGVDDGTAGGAAHAAAMGGKRAISAQSPLFTHKKAEP